MRLQIIYRHFRQMLLQIKQDPLLFLILFVPFLIGFIFRYLLPILDGWIEVNTELGSIFPPYYQLLDSLLLLITPSMINYVAAMVILEEADEKIIPYFAVTPLKRSGYLVGRLVIPTLITVPISLLVSYLFSHTSFVPKTFLLLAFVGTAQGLLAALMIVTLSSNKVEGLAIGKMASLLSLGLFIPYIVPHQGKYFFSVTPAFWIAESFLQKRESYLLYAAALVACWCLLLFRWFQKKLF